MASTESAGRCRYRRATGVNTLGVARPDIRRREGVRLGLAPTPTGFAESVICYVGQYACLRDRSAEATLT